MLLPMRSVVVKRSRSALAGLGLIIAACGSQPAPAATPQVDVASSAPTLTAPAAQPAAEAHAEHGSCGQAHEGPGAAAQGCCGGGACGAAEGHGHGAACGASEHKAPAQPVLADRADKAAAEAQLTRIHDPSEVCMVRNHFMGRPQLSVSAGSSTYYGCCPGCANRLLQDAKARVAIDPVSHHPVDKALAVLAKTPRGNVLYFESEETLSAFRAGFN